MSTNYTNFENDIHAVVMICELHYTSAIQPLINNLDKTQGIVKTIRSPAGLKELDNIIESEISYIYKSLSKQYVKFLTNKYYTESGLKCFIKCILMDNFKKTIES